MTLNFSTLKRSSNMGLLKLLPSLGARYHISLIIDNYLIFFTGIYYFIFVFILDDVYIKIRREKMFYLNDCWKIAESRGGVIETMRRQQVSTDTTSLSLMTTGPVMAFKRSVLSVLCSCPSTFVPSTRVQPVPLLLAFYCLCTAPLNYFECMRCIDRIWPTQLSTVFLVFVVGQQFFF